MLASILPTEVACVDVTVDPSEAYVFPEEEPYIANAVEGRRREFVTGRYCARGALARIGVPATAILPGTNGEPQWPDGVVGSITHCSGYRAAAAAPQRLIAALGIDAEPHLPLPLDVLDTVALAAERCSIATLSDAHPGVCWDRILFSAKESVYKAWFPTGRRIISFEHVAIDLRSSGYFVAQVLSPTTNLEANLPPLLPGRWTLSANFVLTAVAIPAMP
ncbi:MAG: 4'-phosphopantetheinyl transferase superfamily protein [Streptosporangiaceae bacterium]|nr:4'-phosphopantetheinyl transferase superfamily protein [Streptosporangiaceae bacterium]